MRIVIKPMGVALVLASAFGVAALLFRAVDKPTGKQIAPVQKGRVSISLAPNAPDRWILEQQVPNSGSMSVTTPPDSPVGNQTAGKITVSRPSPQKPENVQAFCALRNTFSVGQNLRIQFWARSPESKSCLVQFGQNDPPREIDMAQRIHLTPEWKSYECWARPSLAYGSKKARLTFQVGDAPGAVEFTGVVVHDPAATN